MGAADQCFFQDSSMEAVTKSLLLGSWEFVLCQKFFYLLDFYSSLPRSFFFSFFHYALSDETETKRKTELFSSFLH